MKTITIGFSRRKGSAIGSEIIQKYMGTKFSHVYFKFKEPHYIVHSIFHAVGRGLSYVCETRFLQSNAVAREFDIQVSDETYYELLNDCHLNSGIKYGYLQNLGIVIVDCLNKLGCKIKKNPLNDGINCSEWAAYLVHDMYGEWTEKEYNLVTPKDIHDFLERIHNG